MSTDDRRTDGTTDRRTDAAYDNKGYFFSKKRKILKTENVLENFFEFVTSAFKFLKKNPIKTNSFMNQYKEI